MGLQEKFLQNGSTFGAGQGGNSADLQAERDAIIGDLKDSRLHRFYSIDGDPNILGKPEPSQLDLPGDSTLAPTAPNRDGQYTPINNTFQHGTYKNSAPSEGVGRI